MTRFARAKGSKSSNQKAPEDSTPWEVMKDQLLQAKKESEDNKNRQIAENQRIENYNNFLKEQKVMKRKATWCDFPEAVGSKKPKDLSASDENKPLKNKNKSKKSKPEPSFEENNTPEANNGNVDNIVSKKKKKKNKKKNINVSSDAGDQETEASHPQGTDANPIQAELPNDRKINKKQNKKLNTNNFSSNTTNSENLSYKHPNDGQNRKDKKKKGDKPMRRKEINDNSFQLIINGKEVQLVRYDGFPIMKKDADRLNELRSSMIKKGIPKSEVNRTMKLERRRAEKALARLKKDVCYNCRKGGHNLSDCPDLKSNIPGVDAAEGICFKCGSTEHRQFECKVQRDKEFRFANCFICKEQGHIARQCPDNPKGLYPNGGCCKLCGDVTHLRKDCPTVQNNNKEGTSIKLPTFETGTNIEDIELPPKPISEETSKKPKKIKF
ncbi:uncharacterized protein [Epargyreus clarus]|uniref:uncharacterized protein n=1 Tax=Epargyreus clarus TaxID=520877 RepID=UPI003C2B7DC4